MKRVAKHILIFLSLVIFTTTIGFNVFAHFCKEDGTTISYVLPNKHTCEQKNNISSCCHKTETTLFKANCCSEQIWSYKLNSEFDHSIVPISLIFQKFKVIACPFFIPTFIYQRKIKEIIDYLPPPRTAKSIRLSQQVFRI